LFDYSIPVIEDFNRDDPTGNYFMDLFIETSGKEDYHFRRYQKLQESLAGVFTILATIHSIFVFIIEMLYDKIYFQKLINNILLSEEEDNTEQKLKKINFLRNCFYNRNKLIENTRSIEQINLEELSDNKK